MQVNVIIDGIPSSCTSGSCSFYFDPAITPTVLSITPTEGQEGTTVTINGTNFSNELDQVTVFIGNAECNMTKSSTTSLTCIASNHAAGSYRVRVLVEGIGFSSGEVCFLYLLTLDSITPNEGSISGGYEVTVAGKGFLELSRVYISDFPWIHNGIGLPQINSLSELYLCPSQISEFDDLIGNFIKDERGRVRTKSEIDERFRNKILSAILESEESNTKQVNEYCDWNIASVISVARNNPNLVPFSVFIDEYPCIISQSNKESFNCTTLLAPPRSSNVNVSVFSQTAILENSLTAGTEFSPTVESLSPKFSPVTGGGRLSIFGSGLSNLDTNSSDSRVKVFIGRVPCRVEFANDSYIVCIPGPHAPGIFRVWVLSPDGVAITEEVMMNSMDPSEGFEDLGWRNTSINESIFPFHEYRLSANTTTLVRGSVAGGEEFEVEGGTFVQGQTRVYIGGLAANIVSLSENKLVVLTPSSAKTIHVEFRVTIIGKSA